jgi:hypothetical protein
MFNISEFDKSGISAAYTAEISPDGEIIGRQGNAVLIKTATGVAVVSAPRADMNVVDRLGAESAPIVDLEKYFN